MGAWVHGLSLLFVAVMGYAAHRASLCTVRAVAAVMRDGRADMLLAFGKAVLWAAAVSGVLLTVFDLPGPVVLAREPAGFAIAGGFLFGAGAAINGGCSLSTLTRLADGDRSMLLTLAAFAAGVAAWSAFEAAGQATTLSALASPWKSRQPWMPVAFAILVIWCSSEAFSLSGIATPAGSLPSRASSYPLPLAAALLGIGGGMLYGVEGAWSYTNFLRASISRAWGPEAGPGAFHALLVLALLGGMFLAARGRASRPPRPALAEVWRARVAGGALMGIGGALVPGGNDTLLLAAIPTFSLQAILSYAALLAGMTATLAVRNMTGRRRAVPVTGAEIAMSTGTDAQSRCKADGAAGGS
jgi:hypothetical protein